MIRSYGVEGLRAIIREHVRLGGLFAEWVEADPEFEIMAPPVLSLINFRYHPLGMDDEADLDRLNEALLHRINDDGRIYLTQNRVGGRYAIRMSIGQTRTEQRHVEEGWAVIRELAKA